MPVYEATQPGAAEETGQGGDLGGTRAEAVEEENLPPMQHKAWGTERLRAPNEVMSVELQPGGCCWGQWRHHGGRRVTRSRVVGDGGG